MNRLTVYMQYCVPQRGITAVMGWLARIRLPWLKNWMIRRFIRKYQIDMQLAVIENPEAYIDFNTFFIRQIKPALRPIVSGHEQIACPVDGTVAQIGAISQNQLLQAKGFYYYLETLLGGDNTLADLFNDGEFATLYLAPRDYHRVHMPLRGTLRKAIFVPGKLFSVNRMTSEMVPQLFSRNERLITLFDTPAGPMAVVLVGAMIVGNIQTVWMDQPIKSNHPLTLPIPNDFTLEKGAELGHFKLGSTVIILFGKHKITWSPDIQADSTLRFGQLLGNILK